MAKFFAAIAILKEAIDFFKALINLIERVRDRNKHRRQQEAKKEIADAIKSGDARKLGNAINKL